MRIAAIFAALVLLLSACGCSDNDRRTDDIPNDEPSGALSGSDSDLPNEAVGNTLELPEEYHPDEIVNAYKTGDTSSLTEYNQEIYDAALSAISEFYSEDFDDYDIVLNAHDYIVYNATYDTNALSLFGVHDPDSETPYGTLIKGKAICKGYTTTFQLLMDMLGVECITISGEALDEEHAWNMVKLGEQWYHVDCTWDDYTPDYDGRPVTHMYLLVTDGLMEIAHTWDHSVSPAADIDDLNYYKNNGLYFEDEDSVYKHLLSQMQTGLTEVEVAVPNGLSVFDMPTPIPDNVYSFSYWYNGFDTYDVIIYHIRYKN